MAHKGHADFLCFLDFHNRVPPRWKPLHPQENVSTWKKTCENLLWKPGKQRKLECPLWATIAMHIIMIPLDQILSHLDPFVRMSQVKISLNLNLRNFSRWLATKNVCRPYIIIHNKVTILCIDYALRGCHEILNHRYLTRIASYTVGLYIIHVFRSFQTKQPSKAPTFYSSNWPLRSRCIFDWIYL